MKRCKICRDFMIHCLTTIDFSDNTDNCEEHYKCEACGLNLLLRVESKVDKEISIEHWW